MFLYSWDFDVNVSPYRLKMPDINLHFWRRNCSDCSFVTRKYLNINVEYPIAQNAVWSFESPDSEPSVKTSVESIFGYSNQESCRNAIINVGNIDWIPFNYIVDVVALYLIIRSTLRYSITFNRVSIVIVLSAYLINSDDLSIISLIGLFLCFRSHWDKST